MQFTKKNNIYIISRITGSQDNILGVSFKESDNNTDIEVIEWDIKEGKKIQTSKDEIFKQVLSGLESVNQSLKNNYKLSKIYFLPSESGSGFVYKFLIIQLIRHYHSGNEFKEV